MIPKKSEVAAYLAEKSRTTEKIPCIYIEIGELDSVPGWNVGEIIEDWVVPPDDMPTIRRTIVSITYGSDVMAILPDGGYQKIVPLSFEDMAEIITLCDCSVEWVNS